ncbi:MAG: Uma2 family endonuclease, partial [Myxococcota bacterium]
MDPLRTTGRMTLDEWGALDEDVPGELVDGVLVEEEMPGFGHEACVSWLLRVLGAWLAGRGFVFGSEAKFGVGERRGRKPDVSVYLPGRPLPGVRDGVTRRPPSIAVEVLSPRPRDQRRDRVDKLAEYARFGVDGYWILDPELRTLEVLERNGEGRYVHVLGASAGAHEVPGCAGLVLDLDALWAELDRLPASEDEGGVL